MVLPLAHNSNRYPLLHPLAGLSGSDNLVTFMMARFPNPLTIQGTGAGAMPTFFALTPPPFMSKAFSTYCLMFVAHNS